MVAHYCATFLKPEMLHVYRQITGCREFRSVVFCQKREGREAFPFPEVVVLPKPRTHQLRRFWAKSVRDAPVQIYEGEAGRIESAVRECGAAVMHVYFGHIGVHLLPFLRRRSLPAVVSFHGADAMVDLDRPAYRAAMGEMLGLADLVLVRSESLAARVKDAGASPDKVRLHRTGIPMEEMPFVQREAPADGRWRLVQACRLIPKKGLPVTLRAFAAFRRRFPAAELVIAGEGPEEASLRALAQELRVAEWVRFAGFLSQPELRCAYGEAHVFVHPSEIGPDGNQEGVPNSMLEAMAMGVPVVATLHGGIPEAMESGRDGLLVPERDAEALAGALETIASDPEQYRAMSAAAARSVRERFELGAQVAVLEGCYREAIVRYAL